MPGSREPLNPNEVLEHSAWMHALARSLVSDPSAAEDLVQETWLTRLTHPPHNSNHGSWLSRVLRNGARRLQRTESRRRRREERSARAGRRSPPAETLLDRAELHRRVFDEVLRLAEPYRTTVLLRYFEERLPQEIAEREALPIATVKTRLRRGLAQLRSRLDALHDGNRESWCAVLWPSPLVTSVGSTGSAGTGVGTALSAMDSVAAPSVTFGSCISTGGIVMTYKPIIAVSAAGLLTLAAGFGMGRATGSVHSDYASRSLAAEAELEKLRTRYDRVSTQLKGAEDENAALARENEASLSRIEELEATLSGLRGHRPGTGAAAEHAGEGSLAVAFGELAQLPEFRNARWSDMAQAVENVFALILERARRQEEGLPLLSTDRAKISAEIDSLARYALPMLGKIPTQGRVGEGALTHPLMQMNLMAAMLERADLPLSDDQRRNISSMGDEYEQEYKALQEGYGEDTLKLEKIIDEVELKRDYLQKMRGVFGAGQRDVVFHPELEAYPDVDILSPLLMTQAYVQLNSHESMESLRQQLTSEIAKKLELETTDTATWTGLVEEWLQDIGPTLKSDSAVTRLDRTIMAGRAQARFLGQLLQHPDVTEEMRHTILRDTAWWLPDLKP